jgi:hypothetical protein
MSSTSKPLQGLDAIPIDPQLLSAPSEEESSSLIENIDSLPDSFKEGTSKDTDRLLADAIDLYLDADNTQTTTTVATQTSEWTALDPKQFVTALSRYNVVSNQAVAGGLHPSQAQWSACIDLGNSRDEPTRFTFSCLYTGFDHSSYQLTIVEQHVKLFYDLARKARGELDSVPKQRSKEKPY